MTKGYRIIHQLNVKGKFETLIIENNETDKIGFWNSLMQDEMTHSDLATRLEKALHQCWLEDTDLRQKIRVILHQSVEYGRVRRVIGDSPDDDVCLEYVRQVIDRYEKHHSSVAYLQKGDPDTWQQWIRKIQGWANGFMKKHHIHGPLRKRSVEMCTTNSVLAFLSGTYHFDTVFEAWFCVLVQNVCRKYIKEELHPNRVNLDQALPIDKFDFQSDLLKDKDASQSQRLRELRIDLLESIDNLSSENRKQLILLHYFHGFSLKEIARKMNKSLNAIYKLHFDALADLRNNLDQHN